MSDAPKKIRVEFITNCSPYNAGEVAGFLPKDAHKLKARGIVKFLDEEPDEDLIVDDSEIGDVDDDDDDDNDPDANNGDNDGDDEPADGDKPRSGSRKSKASKGAAGSAKGTRKKKRVRATAEE